MQQLALDPPVGARQDLPTDLDPHVVERRIRLDALDLYYEGLAYYRDRLTGENPRRAESAFASAVQEDPQFAARENLLRLMDLSDKVQSRHDIVTMVWDFFESIPFYRMSPRQDLVSAGHCLAEPGHRYLVYLHCGMAWPAAFNSFLSVWNTSAP